MLFSVCSPALLFLISSIIIVIISFYQNFSFESSVTLGKTKLELPMTAIVYVLASIGIVTWTLFLNKLCKLGYAKTTWGLFLLPCAGVLAIMFGLIAMHGLTIRMQINDIFGFFLKVNNNI